MERKELEEKLNSIKDDKEFWAMLFEQDTPDKIQAAFSTKGIDLSINEVEQLVAFTADALENNNGELKEEELDNVAGGFSFTAILGMAVVAGLTALGAKIGWDLGGCKSNKKKKG